MPLLRLVTIGDRLLGKLVQAGWIERSPDVRTGDLYRITEAGRCADKVERNERAKEMH